MRLRRAKVSRPGVPSKLGITGVKRRAEKLMDWRDKRDRE